MQSLFEAAARCLTAVDPDEKVRLTAEAVAGWRAGVLALDAASATLPASEPGRPERPRLVAPRDLPGRGLGTVEGHGALIHAIAHIEFNAINLAWDAVCRFRGLPAGYYEDWVTVAGEEARHFDMLRDHLRGLHSDYGLFDAHDGLWQMALQTAADPLERMALVPRVLEARGLDVTPGIRARLQAHGDTRGADILDVILRDEVGHVAAGSRWFRHLCGERGLSPEPTFQALIRRHFAGALKGPFNLPARRAAGFTDAELQALAGADVGGGA
jgi:uncharacterized ferritin-like protein (DUF455 family)